MVGRGASRPRTSDDATDTDSAEPSRDRLPSLTGLRGWAALLVVLYHFSTDLGRVPGVDALVAYGRTGVTLFFVLSGFVLAYTYPRAGAVPWRVFYWRRFARVWPLHVAVLAGAAVLLRAIDRGQSGSELLAALFLVHAWSPRFSDDTLDVSWSISAEAFFYLVFPVVLAAAQWPGRWRRSLGLLFVLSAIWFVVVSGYAADQASRGAWELDYLPPVRLVHFAAGVVVGVAFHRGLRCPLRLRTAVATTVAFHLALQLWVRLPAEVPLHPYSGSQALVFPLFALLIWAAADSDRGGASYRVLAGPWALRLGHWSFALYLLHPLTSILWRGVAGQPSGLPTVLLAWATCLTVGVVGAAVAYICFERPVERWLRRRGPSDPGRAPVNRPASATPGPGRP